MSPREMLDARLEQLKAEDTAFGVYAKTAFYREADVCLLPPQSSNISHTLDRLQKKQKQDPRMRVVDFIPRVTEPAYHTDRWGHGLKSFNYVNAYDVIEWDLLQWFCSFRASRLRRLLAITYGGSGHVDVPGVAKEFGFRYTTLVNDLPVLNRVGVVRSRRGKRASTVVLTDSEHEALWPRGSRQPPAQVRTESVLEACLKHGLSLQATIDILRAAKCDDLGKAHVM